MGIQDKMPRPSTSDVHDAPLTGVWIGTGIFALTAVVACVVGNIYVSVTNTDKNMLGVNRSVASLCTILAVICMWMQWLCAYMHQLNPMISPIPEREDVHS